MKYLLQFAIISWFLFSISIPGKCQFNLVPNSSFEVYDTCPNNLGLIRYCPPWKTPLNSTPDYYNSCDTGFSTFIVAGVPQNIHGYQLAHFGNGYSGIITFSYNGIPTNYREYIQAPLLDTLLNGVEYFIKFYVSPGDSCKFVSNNIGVYFSETEIDTFIFPASPLPFIPVIFNPSTNDLSDRNVWTEISGSFIANGNERYVIIGNFDNSLNTNYTLTNWGTRNYGYLYIDDILLSPTDSLTGISEYDITQLNKPKIFFEQNSLKIFSNDIINSITVYDSMGKLVYNENNIEKLQFSIDAINFNSGVYIIQVSDLNKIQSNIKIFKP